MRISSKLGLLAAAVLAALTVGTAGPALADPPSGVTPRASDVAGVGSDTTQFLYDQLSHDYNKAHAGAASKLYSWDAVPQGSMITPKAGCNPIVRPTGSSAGISALETSQTITGGTGFCIDYARSSRARSSSDPACATGGTCFIKLAGDAVTWASRSAPAGGTNAPATLTLAQLQAIYLCTDTNWDQVGGANAPIHAFLPQTSSGTRAFFLLALGGGTTPLNPGPCVSDSNNTLIENEGVAPELNDPNAIFPYSVADYIAQAFHSAPCSVSGCNYPNAPTCTPAGSENLFGCNETGVLVVNKVNNTTPTTPVVIPPDTSTVKAGSQQIPTFPLTWGNPPYTLVVGSVKENPALPAGFTVDIVGGTTNPRLIISGGTWPAQAGASYVITGSMTDSSTPKNLTGSFSYTVKVGPANHAVNLAHADLDIAREVSGQQQSPAAQPPAPVINRLFDPLFQRTVYTVVRFGGTADDIPAYLEPFFASASASTPGWICSNSKGSSDIQAYGFLKLGSACGTPLP